ncbi:MAG: hypothetical protein PHR53_01400 [Bacteroidales bacterium]|nr:hypothetical protein [Bacteroidales bacterium]
MKKLLLLPSIFIAITLILWLLMIIVYCVFDVTILFVDSIFFQNICHNIPIQIFRLFDDGMQMNIAVLVFWIVDILIVVSFFIISLFFRDEFDIQSFTMNSLKKFSLKHYQKK